jgi:hypothetical protein
MAKKKRKLSREERKRQRREAIARKRKERGWEPQRAPSVRRKKDEVIEDMLPLFPSTDDPSASPASGMEQLMMTLLASEDMVDEPEFEEIIVDPMLCLDTFSEIVQELDMKPESLEELSVEDREDTQMDILVGVTRRLLTDELRQDILNGLNTLRLRLKQSGDREEAARAATLQSFLSGDASSEIWPMIGLVQAIFHRSLTIGSELLEASMEAMETVGPGEGGLPLYERLAQSSLVQKAESLLKKTPGLRGFLDKQVDKIWEEGVRAVFEGELYLQLFSPEELETGFGRFRTVFGNIAQDTPIEDHPPREMSQREMKALILQLDDYITELFTPKRLGQLRARLDAILRDPAYKGKWIAFISMLAQYMANEDAVENEKRFLIQSLLGEMRVVTESFQEANG